MCCVTASTELVQTAPQTELDAPCLSYVLPETDWIASLGGQLACGDSFLLQR